MRKDALYKVLEYQDKLLSQKIAGFDKPYRFSGRYKCRKRLIIKAAVSEGEFEQGYGKAVKTQRIKYALLVLLALILCGFGIFIISKSSGRESEQQNTNFNAPASDGYSQIIEDTVNYTEIPLWYSFDKKEVSTLNIFTNYNSSEGRAVTLRKWDESEFTIRYDNDEFEKISVNGYKGLLADRSDKDNNFYVIYWNNDGHAFEIMGNFKKEELLDIAVAAEIWDGQRND